LGKYIRVEGEIMEDTLRAENLQNILELELKYGATK
jgi:hypothetical protein